MEMYLKFRLLHGNLEKVYRIGKSESVSSPRTSFPYLSKQPSSASIYLIYD